MPDHMLPWENENSIDTVRGSVESTLHRLCTANLEDVHSENVYAAIRGSLNWLLEPVVRDWYSRRLWPDERASFSLLVTHTMVTALQVVRSDGPYIGLSFLVRRIHVPSQDPKILTLTPASASSEPLLGRGLDDGKPSFISSRFHGLTPLLTFYHCSKDIPSPIRTLERTPSPVLARTRLHTKTCRPPSIASSTTRRPARSWIIGRTIQLRTRLVCAALCGMARWRGIGKRSIGDFGDKVGDAPTPRTRAARSRER